MTISICSSVDGRVRLTTKSGTTFDGVVVRSEWVPPTILLVQPIGFQVAFGELVPELLRVVQSQLADAGRVQEPAAVPDVDKLRKALEWPDELAAFRDRFRFDEYAGCAYHSDGQRALAEFPK